MTIDSNKVSDDGVIIESYNKNDITDTQRGRNDGKSLCDFRGSHGSQRSHNSCISTCPTAETGVQRIQEHVRK